MRSYSMGLLAVGALLSSVTTSPAMAYPAEADISHGNNGVEIATISEGETASYTLSNYSLRTDGKIYASGNMTEDGVQDGAPAALLVRLNADGTLDSSFTGDGWERYFAVAGLNSYAYRVLPLPNDQVMLVGSVANPDLETDFPMAIRLNADGSLDASFGDNGVFHTNPEGLAFDGIAAAFDSLGRTYILGPQYNSGGEERAIATTKGMLLRLTIDGEIDTTFGAGEGVEAPNLDNPRDVAVDGLNRVWVAGSVGSEYCYVARFLEDGTLDTDFSDNGYAIVSGNSVSSAQCASIQVTSDYSAFVAGLVDGDVAVYKFQEDGTFDTAFNTGGTTPGIATFSLPTYFTQFFTPDQVDGISISSNGSIMVSTAVRRETGEACVRCIGPATSVTHMLVRFTWKGVEDSAFNDGDAFVILPTNSTNINFETDGVRSLGASFIADEGIIALGTAFSFEHVYTWKMIGNEVDTQPDLVDFLPEENVTREELIVSEYSEIVGLDDGIEVPIAVFNGEYSVNYGDYTSLAGVVENGDQVSIRHTASSLAGRVTTTLLAVGGVNRDENPLNIIGPQTAVLESRTAGVADSGSSGGSMDWLMLLCIGLLMMTISINEKCKKKKSRRTQI